MSSGIAPNANAQGGIDFVNGAGKVQFTIPAPYMADASRSPGGISKQADWTIAPSTSGYTLTLALAPTWLAAPGRVFPVTVDPTLEFQGAERECDLMWSAYPNSNYCASTPLEAGNNVGTLERFDWPVKFKTGS